MRHDFGLDRPLPVQYALMMKKLFITRDLTSFVNRGAKVIPQITAGGAGHALARARRGGDLGGGRASRWASLAAVFRGTPIDAGVMILGLIGISMPVFWLGEVVNLLTQSRFHDTFLFSWVPPLGYIPFTQSPVGLVQGAAPPVAHAVDPLHRHLRARAALERSSRRRSEDYVRTARAKGLTERRVLLRHALRTSLIAFVSLFGLDFGALVGGGALLTEVVFGLHGIGKLTYDSLAEPRPAGDHGDRHLRRVLRRRRERGRRPRLRVARPAGAPCLSRPPLLEVRDLRVSFRTEDGVVHAVDGLSLTLGAGEVLGIVGESGSGKTVSMMAVMRLIRDPNAIDRGRGAPPRARPAEALAARDARGPRRRDRDDLPGSDDGADAVYTVGWQIAEQLRAHERAHAGAGAQRGRSSCSRRSASRTPTRRVDDYPHQFSGGMRQRVMIAMALSCNPSLLIADEPTTALDVTIQAQILELMKRLQRDYGSSILLITHDMGVVAEIAERVVVMYAGSVVEEGPKSAVFRDPQHPYTWGLLGSIPRVGRPRVRRLAAIPGLAAVAARTARRAAASRRAAAHRFERCSTRPELLERVAPGPRGRLPPRPGGAAGAALRLRRSESA